MAIIRGHKFHAEHGFTGSAHPNKDHLPMIPGYKRGGDVEQDKALIKSAVAQQETAKHGGKHTELHIKRGGKVC